MSGQEYDFTNILEKPIVIVTFVFLVVFYIIYTYITSSSHSSSSNVFEGDNDIYSFSDNGSSISDVFFNIIIFLFVLFVIFKGYQILFDHKITTSIYDILTTNPKIDIHLNDNDKDAKSVAEEVVEDEYDNEMNRGDEKYRVNQVFNIPGNIYTYDKAQALCNAYDGRLATYNEIENSYKDGGEWCNYGWSEGQHVYFPTQEKTYNILQGIKGHEHDCGRPGINGGYISNPKAKFGVNCYGKKPKITATEKEIMETSPLYPLNKKDVWFNKQVDYFKKQIDNIIISPFNKKRWSASLI